MKWDILARGFLRYILPAGGVAGLLTFVLGGVFRLLMLFLGIIGVALSLMRSSGTGTAAMSLEPASGVNIDPQDYATKPIGSKNVRAFFLSVGLIFGAATGILLT
ncbi:MAG: hypothetical protein V5A56_13155 [Halolamina sp.]